MKKLQRTANPNLMRAINRALILTHLRREAPQSRAQLAQHTGLTRSTVGSLVDDLCAAKLIHETGTAPSRGGRPGTQLALNPAGGCAIGVEIGGDAALVMLADFVAQPRWEESFALTDTDPDIVIPQVEALIDAALAYNADHDAMTPLGIGLGLSGLVNAAHGTLTRSATLGWRDIPFRERWERRFRLPVHAGNEASIAALGEQYLGVARSMSDFIYLGIGTRAIGAGLFVNGELFQGIDGYAGEVGHMQIDPAGARCTCGKHGCWEALLRAETADRDWQSPDALDRIAAILSVGIANLVNVFNPQAVILGGTVGRALADVLPTIRAQVTQQVAMPDDSIAQIVLSGITSNACALGAVALVLDDIVSEPV